MNEYDSNKISDLMKSIAYQKIDKINEADCFILTLAILEKKQLKKFIQTLVK